MFDITAYGASPTLSDNAPAINAAISACHAAGGGEVLVPPGTFRVVSQIRLEKQVMLRGACAPFHWFSNGAASVLQVKWGYGVGSSLDPARAAITVVAGCGVTDLTIRYPDQNVQGDAAECGATISWDHREGFAKTNVHVENVHFDRAYVAADLRGHGVGNTLGTGYIIFKRNTGSPLYRGLKTNFLVEWSDFSDNFFNCGNVAPAQGMTPLATWACNHGIVYECGRGDWYRFVNCRSWGYLAPFNFDVSDASFYSGIGPFEVIDCAIDAARLVVNLQGRASIVNVSGCLITSFVPFTTTGTWCMGLGAASGAQVVSFTNNRIFGPNAGWIWLGQPDQQIGSVLVTDNVAEVTGGDRPLWITSADRVTYAHNIARGYASAPTITAPVVNNSGNC